MRDLIHQADVDHAESVLEQLHHLGNLRGADRHHSLERLRIEQRAHLRARRRRSADYLRNVPRLVIGLPGSTRSGEKHRKKSRPTSNPDFSQHRQNQLVGRAGIGGRFKNHQHARMEVFRDLLARRDDVAHVRILGLAQRRRNADVDRVQFRNDGEIRGGIQLTFRNQLRDLIARHILHIRMSGIELGNFRFHYVNARNRISGLGILSGKRQSDIAQTDNSNAGCFLANLVAQLVERLRKKRL